MLPSSIFKFLLLVSQEPCILHYLHRDKNNSLSLSQPSVFLSIFPPLLGGGIFNLFHHRVHYQTLPLLLRQRTISGFQANIIRMLLPHIYVPYAGKLQFKIYGLYFYLRWSTLEVFDSQLNLSFDSFFLLFQIFCLLGQSSNPFCSPFHFSSFSYGFKFLGSSLIHFPYAVSFLYCFSIFSSPVLCTPIFKCQ